MHIPANALVSDLWAVIDIRKLGPDRVLQASWADDIQAAGGYQLRGPFYILPHGAVDRV